MGAPKNRNFRINQKNDLSRGLVFFGPTGPDMQDARSGIPGRIVSSSNGLNSDAKFGARSYESNTVASSAMYWESFPHRFFNGSPRGFTMLCFAELDSSSAWSTLFGLADNATTRSSPWMALGFGRSSTTTSGRVQWDPDGGAATLTSNTGFLELDGSRRMYGVKYHRDIGTPDVIWLKDRDVFQAQAYSSLSLGPRTGDSNDIVAMGPYRGSDEGTNGRFIVGAIWDRYLSEDEVLAWHDDPYQVVHTPHFAFTEKPTDVRFAPVKGKPKLMQPTTNFRVDWLNPITRDLKFAFIAPVMRDLVTGAEPIVRPIMGTGPLGMGPKTISGGLEELVFPSNSDIADIPDTNTLIFIHYRTGQEGSNPGFLCYRSSFADGVWQLYDFSGYPQYGSSPGSSTGTSYSAATFPSNAMVMLAHRSTTTTSHSLRWRYSGATSSLNATSAGSVTPSGTEDHTLSLGGLEEGSQAHQFGTIYAALIFHRTLSDAEIDFIFDNHRRILIPNNIHVPFNEKLPELAVVEKPW